MRIILKEALKSASQNMFEVHDSSSTTSVFSINCNASPLIIFVAIATMTTRQNVKLTGHGIKDLAKGRSTFEEFGLAMEMSPG